MTGGVSPRRHREPRQGILPFVIRHGNGEEVTAHAGLPLVVEATRAGRLEEVVEAKLTVAKRQRGFSETEKLEALILLVVSGGDRIEDIRILAEDKGLLRLLDRELPSPDALLDFLGAFDDPQVWAQSPEAEKSWVPPETPPLMGLFEVNCALVARAAARQTTTATIDHDGTIIEAHKRDAVVAYEGPRGYQPLVAVWVEEDLIIADKFGDGNVPGNKDPLTSVRRAFAALPDWVDKRYFRGDSADDYGPLLKYLVKEQITFSISADMSPELRAVDAAVPTENWRRQANIGPSQPSGRTTGPSASATSASTTRLPAWRALGTRCFVRSGVKASARKWLPSSSSSPSARSAPSRRARRLSTRTLRPHVFSKNSGLRS